MSRPAKPPFFSSETVALNERSISTGQSKTYNYEITKNDDNRWAMPMQRGDFQTLSEENLPPESPLERICRSMRHETRKEYYLRKALSEAWWCRIDNSLVEEEFDGSNFLASVPTEQFIIGGRQGVGVRCYNYGELLQPENVGSIVQFYESATQCFGDRAVFNYVKDIVITPLAKMKERDNLGFRRSDLEGVIFINSNAEAYIRQGFSMRYVLSHEFGHPFHGFSKQDKEHLSRFAQDIGWDMKQVEQRMPNWFMQRTDMRNDKLSPPVAQNGGRGVPSEYSKKSPRESFAEAMAFFLAGEGLANYCDDAFYRYCEYSGKYDSDFSVPIDWTPSIVERRTGDDILYPRLAQ